MNSFSSIGFFEREFTIDFSKKDVFYKNISILDRIIEEAFYFIFYLGIILILNNFIFDSLNLLLIIVINILIYLIFRTYTIHIVYPIELFLTMFFRIFKNKRTFFNINKKTIIIHDVGIYWHDMQFFGEFSKYISKVFFVQNINNKSYDFIFEFTKIPNKGKLIVYYF